jgi:hypothetical protein
MKLYKHFLFPTWTKRRLLIVVAVALVYGIWFNFLDSAAYCPNQGEKDCDDKCSPVSIGSMFGGDLVYQPWNVIGHCIPGLFLVWWTPKRLELFIAGALISSVIMDSPLWGVIRLGHHLPLWYMNEKGENFVNTCDLGKWIEYYYKPNGLYPVWNTQSGLPNAAMIFWSIIGRSVAAILLIYFQSRQEKMGKDFSLVNSVLKIGKAKTNKSSV